MIMKKIFATVPVALALMAMLASCKKSSSSSAPVPKDPVKAPAASIDRFSATAGHLQVRNSTNGLPAANAPVNFDQAPFITQGLSADGKVVQYYNFDVQPVVPAPIYVFFKDGQTSSVPGQNNVIDVIPGDATYNDFWQVIKVTVPSNYVANTVTSYQEIVSAGYTMTPTSSIVNCPVVPKGSTAARRLPADSDKGLTTGWYKDMVVYYFNFAEKALATNPSGQVPVIPIYVSFTVNPGQSGGGPASGFKTEMGTQQTHNVVTAIPSDPYYTPLWSVAVYDNASFGSVKNETSAMAAPLLVPDAGKVNCPVVSIQ